MKITKEDIGKKVRRIESSHMGMKTGDIATIKAISGIYSFNLIEYEGGHEPNNFELVEDKWQDHSKNQPEDFTNMKYNIRIDPVQCVSPTDFDFSYSALIAPVKKPDTIICSKSQFEVAQEILKIKPTGSKMARFKKGETFRFLPSGMDKLSSCTDRSYAKMPGDYSFEFYQDNDGSYIHWKVIRISDKQHVASCSGHNITSDDITTFSLNKLMTNIIDYAKNLVLSKKEKLLRKHGLKDGQGSFTPTAKDLVNAKLMTDSEDYLVTMAEEYEADLKAETK